MNDTMRDLTAIATAVIGLAVITVLVRNTSNTSQVLSAAASGYSNVLQSAMGGTPAPLTGA